MVRISEPFFEATPEVPPKAPASRRTIGWIAIVLPAIWASGCLTIALIRVRLWRHIRIIVRASTPLTLPGIETPSGLQIRSTEGLLEPGVVGLWRPALLLPAGLERDLTPSQLRAVVSHEVSHVRRRDNVTAGVHMLVEVLFWFHPLVWWIGSRLVDERERACDEEVLRLLGEPEAMDELLYESGTYYNVVAQSSEIFGAQMVGRRDSQLIAVVPGQVSTMSQKSLSVTLLFL